MTDYPVPPRCRGVPSALIWLRLLWPVRPAGPFIPLVGRFIPPNVSGRTVIKIGFLMVVVGDVIWSPPTDSFRPAPSWCGVGTAVGLELPGRFDAAKNSAAFTFCSSPSSTTSFITGLSAGHDYLGKIDFASQFVLIFLASAQFGRWGDGRRPSCCGSTTIPTFVARLHRGVLHSYAVIFRLGGLPESLSSFS